ncbi:MAG: integrase family protein [Gammaproteobacteria bacterium]|nr:integrase family protein [Gammaproteobacteria bacterium]
MAERLHFTKAAIAALPPAPHGKRAYYRDDKVRGLQLAVTDHGAKSFILYRRMDGRPTRYFLGHFPDLTPENARAKAESIRGRMAMGENVVVGDRTARAQAVTAWEVFQRYKAARSTLKPRTLAGYQRFLELAFPAWKDRPIAAITKDAVGQRHLELTQKHGPAYADGAMRFLRALVNFALAQYEAPDGTPLLPDNPVKRLSQTRAWNKVKRRTTVIRQSQIKAFVGALLELKAEPARLNVPDTQGALVADYVLLLLLTGLRRSEAASLQWAEIDFVARTLTVRDTKNGDDHTLPLSDYLFELLQARREITDSRYVFPGSGVLGYLTEPRPQMVKISKASGVSFTLHDLRRTFATIADALDTPAYALKRLLNHRMANDVTAGYIVPNVERLRRHMQAITDLVLTTAEVRLPNSVATSTDTSI